MRKTFVENLKNFSKDNANIMVLTADLGTFFESFKQSFPNQFLNCGVAEENMIGVAAGLTLSGKKVFCYSISPFLAMRALDSIKVNICRQNLNVVLLAAGGGLVYGVEGMTHWAMEDIAVMRSLPNMTVVAPGDLLEVEALVKESVAFDKPLYIRFGKDNALPVHDKMPDFKIGKGIILNQGKDVAIISCGSLLFEAKKAAEKLAEKGINATLVSMHTIKPIDKNLLLDLAQSHKLIVTLEDHSIIGGLGSTVGEALPNFTGLVKLALPDEYPSYIGSADYLYKCYGLDSQSVAEYIIRKL